MYRRPVKFKTGRLIVSHRAVEALIRNNADAIHLVKRHSEGDYGEGILYWDRVENEKAVAEGRRVTSRYELHDHSVIVVFTSPSRDRTFVKEEGEHLCKT